MRRFLIQLLKITLVLFLQSAAAIEATKHGQTQNTPAYQWEVVDIAFQSGPLPTQPIFVQLSAVFRNGAQQIHVHGFYNGGSEYRLRFTPPSKGTWKYTTRSNWTPLDRQTGVVQVKAARTGQKGGIIVNPSAKRTFQYENGDDYFPIAFEADWLFALDADNPDDIPETRRFVDQLAANGFNQIVMNVFAYDVSWKKDPDLRPEHDYGSPKSSPFGGSNEEPDHSKLNIEYFRRLDRVIDYLNQKGIAAHLMIYVWNKLVNWPEARSKADNRYFDYVVKRYQAFPNLIWDISKEALGYGRNDVTYIHDRIKRLRGLDSYERLITVHDYSYCRRFNEKIDFISVQLWGSELYGVMRKVVSDMPGKPILNIEHGGYEEGPYVVFEGNYVSPEVCLERAWQCVFAGTYPTHYWQGAAWNVIIPNLESLDPEARPRFDYYRNMSAFVEKYQIASLTAGDKKSASGFCLHDEESLFLFYVPKENSHIDIRLKPFQGKTMTQTWFNPFTGEFTEPKRKTIPQWPRLKVPEGEGFRILVVQIED